MTEPDRDVDAVHGASTGPTDRGTDHAADDAAEHPVGAPTPSRPTGSWDQRIAALTALDDRPLTEHADAYDALHNDLKRRLGEVDGH